MFVRSFLRIIFRKKPVGVLPTLLYHGVHYFQAAFVLLFVGEIGVFLSHRCYIDGGLLSDEIFYITHRVQQFDRDSLLLNSRSSIKSRVTNSESRSMNLPVFFGIFFLRQFLYKLVYLGKYIRWFKFVYCD